MNPLDKQVDGKHYKDCKIQPIEYIQANGLGYCEGNVIKYITRHKQKGGKEDLLKAIHYIELLLQIEYPEPLITEEVPVPSWRSPTGISGGLLPSEGLHRLINDVRDGSFWDDVTGIYFKGPSENER